MGRVTGSALAFGVVLAVIGSTSGIVDLVPGDRVQAIVAHVLPCHLPDIIAWRDSGVPGVHIIEEVAHRPPGRQLCPGDPAPRPVRMVRLVIRRHENGPYGIVLVTAFPTRGGDPPCPHY